MGTLWQKVRNPAAVECSVLFRVGERRVERFATVAMAPNEQKSQTGAHQNDQQRGAHLHSYHPGKGGFPGDDLGMNGAHLLLQSPPFCPHLFARSSSLQSSSVSRPYTPVRKKLITFAATAPAVPSFV